MKQVFVNGLGLWATGFADLKAWRDERADQAVTEPACSILPARLARGTSLVARMMADTMAQAAGSADMARAATVFGSALGEIRTAFDIMEMIRIDGVPTPVRFMNSVHNTVCGQVSIACGNTGFSTALAAGSATVPMCLLEAIAFIECHGGTVVVAVGDEGLPEPLDAMARYESLSMAWQLSVDPTPMGCLGTLSGLRRDISCRPRAVLERFSLNPCAGGLQLVDALLERRPGAVRLDLDGDDGWCVDVGADLP